MLDARDRFENNGGIRLCRLKTAFTLHKKKREKDKWEREHYKGEQTMIKRKRKINRLNKTIYKEEYQSQITKHTDIRIRKVWYELKRKSSGWTCASNCICHKTKFSHYQSSRVSGEFELSLTSTQDIFRIGGETWRHCAWWEKGSVSTSSDILSQMKDKLGDILLCCWSRWLKGCFWWVAFR